MIFSHFLTTASRHKMDKSQIWRKASGGEARPEELHRHPRAGHYTRQHCPHRKFTWELGPSAWSLDWEESHQKRTVGILSICTSSLIFTWTYWTLLSLTTYLYVVCVNVTLFHKCTLFKSVSSPASPSEEVQGICLEQATLGSRNLILKPTKSM